MCICNMAPSVEFLLPLTFHSDVGCQSLAATPVHFSTRLSNLRMVAKHGPSVRMQGMMVKGCI